ERAADLSLVASSYQVPLIILTYLGVVFILLQFMKNRPAYSLKIFIQIYNVAQILLNSFVLYGYLKAGMFTRTKLFLCPVGDFTVNDVTIGLINTSWYYMILKIFDCVETMIFILRKKNKQVSGLHLYHHTTTLLLTWIVLRYACVVPILFIPLINSFVHILMYIYYFLAACGPKIQKTVGELKRYLTLIQMMQFIVILLYEMQNFIPNCKVLSHWFILLYMGNTVINLCLFYQFYRKTYNKSTKVATKEDPPALPSTPSASYSSALSPLSSSPRGAAKRSAGIHEVIGKYSPLDYPHRFFSDASGSLREMYLSCVVSAFTSTNSLTTTTTTTTTRMHPISDLPH
ncbi:hypothetical protein HN011_010068, partial [Eciton burchellii]